MSNFDNLKNEISNTSKTKTLEPFIKKGLEDLEELELPHRRIETWKYTNLNSAFEKPFSAQNIKAGSVSMKPDKDFFQICEINGKVQFIDEELKNVLSITEINQIHSTDDLSILKNDSFYTKDFLKTLSTSSLEVGYILKVKKNTTLEKPIKITQQYFGNLSFHNCNYIFIIEDSADINIIHEQTNADECMINSKYSFDLAQNAKVNHLFIQNNSKSTYTFSQFNTKAERDSHYHNTILNLGSKLSRNNIYVDLIGENALADANGLFILDETQHHDTNCYIKHSKAHTFSNQLYKGILADESRGVFAGIIRIDRDAQLVNSTQLNKNLLLSKKAQVFSRPQLEIYADDVKCAHGSTTGQLSMDELFYFQARGISAEKAKSMLARAFINDVLLKIEEPRLQEYAMDICQAYEVNLL